ncbi:MAG: hypothetical protein RIS94_371 [Pseudomonadota bacterium]|jgi:cytoskeletal protein RodZ
MDDGSDAVIMDGAEEIPGDGAFDPLPQGRAVLRVGARLKTAREAAGLSLQDIAGQTRITQRHVEAVEAGDFASLPGRPYAIGFARSYARAVGMDDAEIADAVRRELDGSAPRPEPRVIHQFEVGDPAKTPSRLVSWLAFALFVSVLAMGVVFWRSYYWPAAELPPLVGAEEQAPARRAPVRIALPVAAPSAGPVVFTALEDAIWVKFSDAQGKQLLQKQLAKGESWTVPADVAAPTLWTGRPDALAVTIGGQPVPRIADHEGIVKDVPVSAAALLARPPQAVPSAQPAPGAQSGPARRASAPAPVATTATPLAAPTLAVPQSAAPASSTAGQ